MSIINRTIDLHLFLDQKIPHSILKSLDGALMSAFPLRNITRSELNLENEHISKPCWNSARNQLSGDRLLEVLEDELIPKFLSQQQQPKKKKYVDGIELDHRSTTQNKANNNNNHNPIPEQYSLLLTAQDCFSGNLNFVFGVARRGVGAIVSMYRLGGSSDFANKECIHELGHVFGLGHCQLPCVMTFSNSVMEAQQKHLL